MFGKKSLSLLLNLFLFTLSFAQNQDLLQLKWAHIADPENIGMANLIPYDFDQNGDLEIIYSSFRQENGVRTSNFHILDYQNGIYENVYSSFLWSTEITWMEVGKINATQTSHYLYLATSNGQIEVFDFFTRSTIATINLDYTLEKFFLEDINNDGQPEIFGHSGGRLLAFDLSGNLLNELIVNNIKDLAWGDIDGDGDQEIALSTFNQGMIVNPVDFTVIWDYQESFGEILTMKDVDGSGHQLLFAAEYSSTVNCFDPMNQNLKWTYELGNFTPITMIEVADAEDDGVFELYISIEAYFDRLKCYQVDNQELLWESTLTPEEISIITFGDFDADGTTDLAYACEGSTDPDHLGIFDLNARTTKWLNLDYSDGYRFSTSYLDSDAHQDYFIGSMSSDDNLRGGLGLVYDGASGQLEINNLALASFYDLVDVEVYTYQSEQYLVFFYDNRIVLYDLATQEMVYSQNTPTIFRGAIIDILGYERPQIVLIYESENTVFYNFQDNVLEASFSGSWPYGAMVNYQFGNFDDDPATEIAILNHFLLFSENTSVNIYDVYSGELEYDLEIDAGSFDRPLAFALSDLFHDGDTKIIQVPIIGNNNNLIKVISLATEEYYTITIEDRSIRAITTGNLDDDPEDEIVVLSERRLTVYDPQGGLLWVSPILNFPESINALDGADMVKVEDINNDGYPEIIAATQAGVFEFGLKVAECPNGDLLISPAITLPVNSMNGSIELAVAGGSPPYNFRWSHDQFNNQNVTDNLSNGYYSVIVTDDNGCSTNTTINLNAVTPVSKISSLVPNLLVYPNPSSGELMISTNQSLANATISVFNLAGQLIVTKNHINGRQVKLDLRSHPPGWYVLKVSNKSTLITQSFLLTK